ncbi:ATP-binding cassette domain-containing protein [Marinicrinis lubricantis]|uniref:ATP-binding cassette domain-containing protein n=1 Tax=Marinicrinis lubricantis TaxID=2086470 RepID=A0ABW1IU05_9BACL
MELSAVRFRNVKKHRKRLDVGPIHLNIPEGYIVALVGQNGSGKSTLLNMLIQTIYPDEGSIEWFGQSFEQEIPMSLRQQIAYVPELPSTEEYFLTPDEAAAFRAHWYPNWDAERYEEMMQRFEVPRDSKLRKMSKGERRKYEIAVSLAARPRLLLLDEPSSGFDPFSWKKLIGELREVMKEGQTTIIMATHIVDEIKRLADYVVLIHRGQMLGMVEKDSLIDSWKEIWLNADSSVIEELPDVLQWDQETPSTVRVITSDAQRMEQVMKDSGWIPLKMRSLELDEILELWIEGHMPNGVY